MLKRWKVVLGVVSALVLTTAFVPQVALAQGGPGGKERITGGYADQRGSLGSTGSGVYYGTEGILDPEEEEALFMALDDEYKALATYLSVMDQFGQVAPFVSIARAEEQHIAALERLFDRYALQVPENEWTGNTPLFDSVGDACAAGVQAEVDNAALYDLLFSMVDNPDIVRVSTSLRNASEVNHLPAFASCADGDGTHVPDTTLGSRLGGSGGRRGGR
jgi:hypothetical protein